MLRAKRDLARNTMIPDEMGVLYGSLYLVTFMQHLQTESSATHLSSMQAGRFWLYVHANTAWPTGSRSVDRKQRQSGNQADWTSALCTTISEGES